MDTANHPPCPVCDPNILPEGYDPIANDAVMVRPDGTEMLLRGAVKVYLDGIDVTNQAKEADPDLGVVVMYHRVMADGHHAREMVRHMCNREGLELYDSRLAGAHPCEMVLTGEVVVVDIATGEAPVLQSAAA